MKNNKNNNVSNIFQHIFRINNNGWSWRSVCVRPCNNYCLRSLSTWWAYLTSICNTPHANCPQRSKRTCATLHNNDDINKSLLRLLLHHLLLRLLLAVIPKLSLMLAEKNNGDDHLPGSSLTSCLSITSDPVK